VLDRAAAIATVRQIREFVLGQIDALSGASQSSPV